MAEKIDNDKVLELFLGTPLRASVSLMKKLKLEESDYFNLRFSVIAPDLAKSILLYGAARQVFKACLWIIQYQDITKEKPEDFDIRDEMPYLKITYESLIDGQFALIRKLIELLSNLINFKSDDPLEIYNVFLSAENLDYYLRRRKELKEFFEMKSENLEHSISDFAKRIDTNLGKMGKTKIWFLNDKRESSVFVPVNSRFKEALSNCTDEERLAIGLSSYFYSKLSTAVHPEFSSPIFEDEMNYESTTNNIYRISILCMQIMDRLYKLSGFQDPEKFWELFGEKSNAPMIMEKFKKEFDVGDIVMVSDHLSEVTEFQKSKYGYTSCKVKYLTKSFLPEIPEDWHLSKDIVLVFPIKNVREHFINIKNIFPSEKELEDTFKFPDDKLFQNVKKILIELDKNKNLIPLLLQRKK